MNIHEISKGGGSCELQALSAPDESEDLIFVLHRLRSLNHYLMREMSPHPG